MARKDLAWLLDARLRLHPACRYEAEEQALWVRRKDPVERLLARLVPSSGPRIRLALDAQSAAVVAGLVQMQPVEGRDLAESLGLPAGPEAVARRDPDLAAFVLFLDTLEKGGAIVTEPI